QEQQAQKLALAYHLISLPNMLDNWEACQAEVDSCYDLIQQFAIERLENQQLFLEAFHVMPSLLEQQEVRNYLTSTSLESMRVMCVLEWVQTKKNKEQPNGM